MSLEHEIKTNGLTPQIIQHIGNLEEFVRKHQTIPHEAGSSSSASDWTLDSNTWTFSSADAPIYIVSVNADVTATISVGMRVRLVHGAATKYFIVHAVGAFSAGATLLTLYGGTISTLSATAITSTYYSSAKVPFAFPADPANWTVSTITSDAPTKATPTISTWYGGAGLTPTGPSLDLPIGAWDVSYRVMGEIQITFVAVGNAGCRVTLSTGNSTESDPEMSNSFNVSVPIGSVVQRAEYSAKKFITVSSKTTYYINIFTGNTGATNILFNSGATFRNIIKATSAYL